MKQGQPGRTGKCLGQSKTKGMKEKGLKKHSGSSMKRAWSIAVGRQEESIRLLTE